MPEENATPNEATEGKGDTDVRTQSPPKSKTKADLPKRKVEVLSTTLKRVDLPKHTHEQTWKSSITTKPCPVCDKPMKHQSMPCPSGVKECRVPHCGWKCVSCDQYFIEG